MRLALDITEALDVRKNRAKEWSEKEKCRKLHRKTETGGEDRLLSDEVYFHVTMPFFTVIR